MKSHEEFIKTVREKAEQYEAERKRRNRSIRNISLLLAVCVTISLSVYSTVILGGASGKIEGESVSGDSLKTSALSETEAGLIPSLNTQVIDMPSVTEEPKDSGTVAYSELSSYAPYVTEATTVLNFTTATAEFSQTVSPWEITVPTGDTQGTGIYYSQCTAYIFSDFYEHFEMMSDRKTLEERLDGKVDIRLYDDELFENHVVYALWVRHDASPYLLPQEVAIDGEPYFRLTEKIKAEKENNYLMLVVVSRSHSRYGGFIAPDHRIIPDTER